MLLDLLYIKNVNAWKMFLFYLICVKFRYIKLLVVSKQNRSLTQLVTCSLQIELQILVKITLITQKILVFLVK